MKIEPDRPQGVLGLGPESLLKMTVTAAARYYGVSGGVVGRRLRPSDRQESDQLALAMA
jgi:hypothetical protein